MTYQYSMHRACTHAQALEGVRSDSCAVACHVPASAHTEGDVPIIQGAYKQELSERHGITFNNLLCLNNMPIKRYVDYLQRRGQLEEYMQVLIYDLHVSGMCACLSLYCSMAA